MNDVKPYAIGIDFGGTSVKMACIAPDGTIAARGLRGAAIEQVMQRIYGGE